MGGAGPRRPASSKAPKKSPSPLGGLSSEGGPPPGAELAPCASPPGGWSSLREPSPGGRPSSPGPPLTSGAGRTRARPLAQGGEAREAALHGGHFAHGLLQRHLGERAQSAHVDH